MKKNLLKLLLISLLFVAIRVKADPNPFLVESNYTTAVAGDTLTLTAGFDALWDEALLIDEENGKNIRPFYIAFPKELTANFDDIKFLNDNYNVEDYRLDYFTDENDITYYIFSNISVKEVKETEDDDLYDGKIDVPLIGNIKVKVDINTDAVHEIETGFYDIEDEEYDDEEYKEEEKRSVVETLPINVISKNSNDKELEFLIFETDSEGISKKGIVDVDLKSGKYDYEILYYTLNGFVTYVNAGCSSRCKVTNIGSSEYIPLNFDGYNEIKVKYENGKTYKYTIQNAITKATINADWATEFHVKNAIVIGNKESSELKSILDLAYISDKYVLRKYYYNYEDLNDVDKKIIKDLLYDEFDVNNYNGPYMFIINDDGRIYKKVGNMTNEEVKQAYKQYGILTEEEKNNSSNSRIINIGDKYLIIGTICVILLIVVITIIVIFKKEKK